MSDKVALGNKVVLKINSDQKIFLIEDSTVTEDGATTISPDSPIGKAILGQKVGGTHTITTPQGEIEVVILEIAQ